MANFGPKPWTNPFVKIPFFRLLELLVFIAQKGVFSFQNIIKQIFLPHIAKNKKVEKWLILDQNHGLTPLEKCHFFEFLNFLFLKATKGVFSFQNIIKTHFPALYCQKRKGGKMANFGPKPWTNPFGKMPFFRLFELLGF